MIVRILEDGQYRLDNSQSDLTTAIEKLDSDLTRELAAGDAPRFARTLHHVIACVHAAGRMVPLEELVPSDVIVPAADMTLAETKQLLPVGQ